MNLLDVRIETARTRQRPITIHDREAIFQYFSREITTYMYPKPADSIDETDRFIRGAIDGLQKGTNLQLVITGKDDEFFGCSGLHNIGADDPELGVWIRKDRHGNGYGLEAVSALIGWARKNIEYDHLKYPVDKRNAASRRIPERSGGVMGNEYKKVNLSGKELDEVEYWIYR